MQLRRGQEVAAAARPGRLRAVVAAGRVVQRELHEPRERHRAGPADLVADPRDELRHPRRRPTGRSAPRAGARAGTRVCPSPSAGYRPAADRRPRASRRPGPTSVCPPSRIGIRAATADAVSSRSHGSATRAGSSRSEANRSSGSGQLVLIRAGSMGEQDPAYPRSPPRRGARGDRRANRAHPARAARPTRDAAGRWPERRVRKPRSSISARVRDAVCASSQARFAADTRPADDELRRRVARPGSGSASMIARTRAPSAAGTRSRHRPPSRTRSSGPSTSIPSRVRPRRSSTAHAGMLSQPARQLVVARQVGDIGQHRARLRYRDRRPPNSGCS